MDPRVGNVKPELGCGFNPSIRDTVDESYYTELDCNATPVVRHLLFNTFDAEGMRPGGVACDEHKDACPPDMVFMFHPIGPFCQVDGSAWHFESNECIMPIQTYENALLGEETCLELDSLVRELDSTPTKPSA